MPLLGSGDFIYEMSGEDWGDIPEGSTYKEATSVAIDANDNIYVFNRGTNPMIVFNTEGKVQQTWGHGIFSSPHPSSPTGASATRRMPLSTWSPDWTDTLRTTPGPGTVITSSIFMDSMITTV